MPWPPIYPGGGRFRVYKEEPGFRPGSHEGGSERRVRVYKEPPCFRPGPRLPVTETLPRVYGGTRLSPWPPWLNISAPVVGYAGWFQ